MDPRLEPKGPGLNCGVKRAALGVVERIQQTATTSAEAAPHMTQMNLLARQLTSGLDVNEDGQVGWQSGEGGLDQAPSTTSVGIPKIEAGINCSGGISASGNFLATVILKATRLVGSA